MPTPSNRGLARIRGTYACAHLPGWIPLTAVMIPVNHTSLLKQVYVISRFPTIPKCTPTCLKTGVRGKKKHSPLAWRKVLHLESCKALALFIWAYLNLRPVPKVSSHVYEKFTEQSGAILL